MFGILLAKHNLMSEFPIWAWLPSLLLGTLWLLIAAGNASCLIAAYQRNGSTSLVLFVGGIFGGLAALISPWPALRPWAWVPAALDPGCIPALLLILWQSVKDKAD